MTVDLHEKLVRAGFLDDSVQKWGNKLLGTVEARAADCCLEDMTEEEQEESLRCMVLDFCEQSRVPNDIFDKVVDYLMGRIS